LRKRLSKKLNKKLMKRRREQRPSKMLKLPPKKLKKWPK